MPVFCTENRNDLQNQQTFSLHARIFNLSLPYPYTERDHQRRENGKRVDLVLKLNPGFCLYRQEQVDMKIHRVEMIVFFQEDQCFFWYSIPFGKKMEYKTATHIEYCYGSAPMRTTNTYDMLQMTIYEYCPIEECIHQLQRLSSMPDGIQRLIY